MSKFTLVHFKLTPEERKVIRENLPSREPWALRMEQILINPANMIEISGAEYTPLVYHLIRIKEIDILLVLLNQVQHGRTGSTEILKQCMLIGRPVFTQVYDVLIKHIKQSLELCLDLFLAAAESHPDIADFLCDKIKDITPQEIAQEYKDIIEQSYRKVIYAGHHHLFIRYFSAVREYRSFNIAELVDAIIKCKFAETREFFIKRYRDALRAEDVKALLTANCRARHQLLMPFADDYFHFVDAGNCPACGESLLAERRKSIACYDCTIL